LRILVTDAHELAGLGAIRSLGRAGHHVIAGYPGRLQRPASTYSNYCSAQRAYPDPWASQQEFCQWLLANAPEWDLILPISEAAVFGAASCQSRLPSSTVVVAASATSLEYTLSKRRATAKALAIGIQCPATAFFMEDVPSLKSPYIVRTDNRLMYGGSYHKGQNWYIDNSSELMDLLSELNENGEKWMVQEHIVGKGVGSFLLTWRGQTLLEFAHERVHEVPFYGGVSSLRRSVRDTAMGAAAARLLLTIGYEGVAMVEFRRCSLNQAPYFVEINGRLWGSLALALHAGADFPAKLVGCYLGTSLPSASDDYATGIYCRNVYPGEVDYIRSVLAANGPVRGVYPPGKARVILEFFKLFFTPGVYYDYLWLRDPLPWIWHSIRACTHVLRSRWNKWQRSARQGRLVKEFERRPLDAVPDLREVLFLCYGNICRSAFAGAYWNQNVGSLPTAQSAGFFLQENRRTPLRISRLAKDLGVDLADHRSKVVDSAAVDHATAIFVMDGQNIEDLLKAFPQARAKTWLLGSFRGARVIHDPYLLPQAEATESLRQIRDSIDMIVERYTDSSSASAPRAHSAT
jgi:protein-tyrosine-phosphatase